MTDFYTVADIRKCFPWISRTTIFNRIHSGMMQAEILGGTGYKNRLTFPQVVHAGVIDTLAKVGALHAKNIHIQYWHKKGKWGGPTLRDLSLLNPEYYETCNYRTVIDVTVNLGKYYLNFWPSLETKKDNIITIGLPFCTGTIFVRKIYAEVMAGTKR